MNGPAKHGLHPYEAGWFTLLKMGLASEKAVVIVGKFLANVEVTGASEARSRKLGAKTQSDILPPTRV